jgi:DNA repair protein RadC
MVHHSERPRERCLSHGAQALSLRECLAVLIGSGSGRRSALQIADEILQEHESEVAFFRSLESADGPRAPGIGPAKLARILSAFELARRYSAHRHTTAAPETSPTRRVALERIPAELKIASREWLGFVPLERGGRLGPFCLVERGVRTHVNVDPAELFAKVLATRPAGFYLFHNHPSGRLEPSRQDEHLTERVAEVARSLGISLLAHGIVGPGGHHWIECHPA